METQAWKIDLCTWERGREGEMFGESRKNKKKMIVSWLFKHD